MCPICLVGDRATGMKLAHLSSASTRAEVAQRSPPDREMYRRPTRIARGVYGCPGQKETCCDEAVCCPCAPTKEATASSASSAPNGDAMARTYTRYRVCDAGVYSNHSSVPERWRPPDTKHFGRTLITGVYAIYFFWSYSIPGVARRGVLNFICRLQVAAPLGRFSRDFPGLFLPVSVLALSWFVIG